jgi:hypothetical protein
MTLLFGQHPQGGMADGQYPLHARVSSVGDVVPIPPDPTPPPSQVGGSGGSSRRPFKMIVKRDKIGLPANVTDEDLLAALTFINLISFDETP